MAEADRAPGLHRVFFATLPATAIPALASIAAVALFTRLLPPGDFGRYTLVFAAVMAAQSVLFTAPALATTRFHAAAAAGGRTASFLASVYALSGAIAGCVCAVLAVASFLLPHGDTAKLWLAAALLLCRAWVAQNQAVNRAAGRLARYTLVECCHALLGPGIGLALVLAGMEGAPALLSGLAAAACVSGMIDARRLLAACRTRIDRVALRHVAAFAWPLALSYAVTCCLNYADRLLVGGFAGAAALGIYGTAWSLVERPITLICTSVTTGTFPLAVEAYVREGPGAGRIQAGRNGALLIGLALPACLGLALCAPAIARVLVGPAYRDGVAALIPVMACTALLRGISAHYIDHAFHLAKASLRMLAVYAPWAAASLCLNVMLVQHCGMPAAAHGALACQLGAALTGWAAAPRTVRLWLPSGQMAKIGLCATAMTGALLVASGLPADAAGLALRIGAGVGTYAAMAWWVDLAGIRDLIARRLSRPRYGQTSSAASLP